MITRIIFYQLVSGEIGLWIILARSYYTIMVSIREFIWRRPNPLFCKLEGQSPLLVCFRSTPEVRTLPPALTGINGAIALSGIRPDQCLIHCCGSRPRIRDGSPPLPKISSWHAVPITPVDRNRWIGYGSVPLRPSQGSRALRSVRLLQSLQLRFVPRASAGWFHQPTVWVTTGMNRQFPRRDFHPLASCDLVAHQYLGCQWSARRSKWCKVSMRFIFEG